MVDYTALCDSKSAYFRNVTGKDVVGVWNGTQCVPETRNKTVQDFIKKFNLTKALKPSNSLPPNETSPIEFYQDYYKQKKSSS